MTLRVLRHWSPEGTAGSVAPRRLHWRSGGRTWCSPGVMPRAATRWLLRYARGADPATSWRLISAMRPAPGSWPSRRAELGGGHVDILVNNAGIYPFGPTHEATEKDFNKVFDLNVKVPFFLVAELAPKMAARGHGVIINVSTMVAEFGMAQMALYGSSKAALVLLTKSWAAEYGPAGVRVNAVSPGPTRTEGMSGMVEALEQLAAAAPAGRPGLPQEIASAIVYLASGEASFVQGVLLPVDGGRVAV